MKQLSDVEPLFDIEVAVQVIPAVDTLFVGAAARSWQGGGGGLTVCS